ncbi:zinc-dependent metalloprotease [Chitinophaga sp. MM2321]|uniref:zinc-dependent metalloprotease n=1 Tax=Chitinophaga sp. MM2321 TaxID=3137178 RepID=UPI0032D59131
MLKRSINIDKSRGSTFSCSILKGLTALVFGCMVTLCVTTPAFAQKAAKKDTVNKQMAYEKLFKNKTKQTVTGLITMHQLGGKLYFEFPVKLLGKPMLIGSVAVSVSHSEDGAAGEQAHDPLCVIFEEKDSVVSIKLMQFEQRKDDNGTAGVLDKSQIAPVLASYKVLAYSPDSSALVFEPTAFFVSGNAAMDPYSPVGGLTSRRTSFKQDRSILAGIQSFPANVTISSYLSFGVTKTFFGFTTAEDRPSTVLMKRTICLLPDVPMRPRINDPRIGVFYTNYQETSATAGIAPVYYANRWRLEPSDKAAFERGELVSPVKPVVFYIDNKFPVSWVPYIRKGVEQWNEAFEKIGFKNAVITRMYPENDTTFDPDNITYNCIKYAPTATQNAMGPSWVDPRTGEILNASVYVYHGIMDVLNEWIFIQTAPADKRARKVNLPMELVGPSLTYVLTHEIGHCLGLMHNMGASSAFPVDSLRSPSFTQQYGTTPSIMDYARFNFVAQPGDMERGVKMTPPPLGVYDYYVINWLYRVIQNANSAAAEVPVLEAFVSEKIKDPMFRYGKQQFTGNLDPNALSEDLGDDQVKATRYAMSNLQYLMEHFNDWVKEDDPDYSFRRKVNFSIINIQFYWYLTHVLSNLGGIYQYEKYEGDPFPAYKVVPKEKQRESMVFLLETLENSSWLNNAHLEKNLDVINGSASGFMQTLLFPYIMRWVSNIGYSEAKGGHDSYTQEECITDVFNYLWKETLQGKTPTDSKLNLQRSFVQVLIRSAGVLPVVQGKENAMTAGLIDNTDEFAGVIKLHHLALENGLSPVGCTQTTATGPVEGFGFMPRIPYQTEDITHLYYSWLVETQKSLDKIVKMQTGKPKMEYEYLQLLVKRALAVK